MRQLTWAALRILCILLAAPHVYPSWPSTISWTAALKILAAVLLVALVGSMILAVVWSPHLAPFISADAFALCQWW